MEPIEEMAGVRSICCSILSHIVPLFVFAYVGMHKPDAFTGGHVTYSSSCFVPDSFLGFFMALCFEVAAQDGQHEFPDHGGRMARKWAGTRQVSAPSTC